MNSILFVYGHMRPSEHFQVGVTYTLSIANVMRNHSGDTLY